MFRWLCRLGRHRPHVWYWMPGWVTQEHTYCERCGISLDHGGRSAHAVRAGAPYVEQWAPGERMRGEDFR